MIKAVIFDMDGVLTDTEPMNNAIEVKLFKELGTNLAKKELKKYTGMTHEETFKALIEKFSLNTSWKDLLKRKIELTKQSTRKIRTVKGAVKLINRTRPFKRAVATSQTKELAHLYLKKAGILGKFHTIVCAEDIKHSKPNPEIFLKAAEKLGIKPNECAVIEDSRNGVIAAGKAGMKCIGFQSRHTLHQNLSQADIIVNDLNKITLEMLEGL